SEAKAAEEEAAVVEKEAEEIKKNIPVVEKEEKTCKKRIDESKDEAKKADEEVKLVEKEVGEDEEIEKNEAGSSSSDKGDYATVKGCETAFAFGEKTFIDLGVTKSRWGWQMGPLNKGTYEAPLFAGAGQNDVTKGTKVGKVK